MEFPVYCEELCHAGLPVYERCPRSHAFVLGAKKCGCLTLAITRGFILF